MKISAVMCVKDVADFVRPALESLDFVDELVVVNVMSQDKSVEIVKEFTDLIFEYKKPADYVEPIRNFAIAKATGDWILVIDADEVVPPELAKKLRKIADSSEATADCYYLPRKNIIFDHWVKTAGWWPDLVLRFFRAGHVEWSDLIHSIPITTGKVEELPIEEKLALVHQNYQSVDQFVSRMNKYSSIQAKELAGDFTKKTTPPDAIKAFTDELLSRLFDRGGISGGFHGVSLSFAQAFSELLVRSKVWQSEGFSTEFENNQKMELEAIRQLDRLKDGLAYWISDWRIQHSSGLTKLYLRLRRKLGW